MKTLFITRKYPPQIGGMESFSYGLINSFPGEKQVIAYGGSQKWLIFVYFYLFLKSLSVVWRNKIDLIHLGDALLAPLGWFLKKLTGRKVVITAHGKDINFNFPLYQKIILPFVRKMDQVVCVSEKTKSECLKRGVPANKCLVIPDGVAIQEQLPGPAKKEISQKFNISFVNKFILLTCGRLSRRKGVLWFIKNVFPLLPANVIYLIVGRDSSEISGLGSWLGIKKIKYSDKIRRLIQKLNFQDRIFYLGEVSACDLEKIYRTADIFVMPNVKVEGDLEGFGIVAIEAASSGLPVVAANLEGLREAIKNGQNGYLVPWGQANGFKTKIEQLYYSPQLCGEISQKAKEYTRQHYSWPQVCQQYLELFQKLVGKTE